jgi:hypothetical protein
MIGPNWITSDELELEGVLAVEWKVYRRAIISSGIQLHLRLDELKWIGGDTSSRISVKNSYEVVEKKKYVYMIGGWRKALWS